MNKKNVLIMVVAMVLVAVVSVGGTMAWLTAESSEVENTFTVGNINITLDEEDTDDSTPNAGRDTENTYKVIPGEVIDKDPTVHVVQGSEKCYVFVKVVNTVRVNGNVVATPNINAEGSTAKWLKVGTVTDGEVYVYTGTEETPVVVDAGSEAKNLVVFTKVTIADTVTKTDVTTLNNTKITVDAYAHQSEKTTYAVALAAALGHFNATADSGN